MLWQKICQSSHAILVHYSVCEDSEVSCSRTPIELHQIRFNYCRKPSSCMIVGSNKSYHSMKQSIILHENFDKPLSLQRSHCSTTHFLGQLNMFPINLEHSFNMGPKIGLSLPTLETGSRPSYVSGLTKNSLHSLHPR